MTGKRMTNARALFAVCFFALITALGGSSVFACLKNHFLQALNADVPAVRSFKDIYPFDDTSEKETFETSAASEKPNIFSAYCDIIYGLEYKISGYLTICSLSRIFYRLKVLLDGVTGNAFIENGAESIVRLSRGYYARVCPYKDTSESWKGIQELAVWLKSRNIPLLQLIPATKMDDSITVFPPGIPHGYTQMMEEYKAFLTENQIPYFEAKDALLAENSDFYAWFYKADHHWNTFAARTVAEAAAKKLNDEFNIKTDVNAVKEENFKLTRYSSVFLGSMAVKMKTKPEDFDVFYQLKESSFHLKIPTIGIDRIGGFNDTLIAQPYLKAHGTYFAFLYGGQPLIQVENKTCANGTRVLVIKHSQGNILCPYLACTVQYLDIIDPRHFDGSVKTFIEQTKPNIVLICI